MRIGSLFSGLGLLDEAVRSVLGGSIAWYAEHDPGDERRAAYCRAVVAARHPNAVSLGDVCGIDGAAIEPVDALVLGFPCQDISAAGGGAGMTGARSGLWSEVPRILRAMRRLPRVVIIENSGLLMKRGGRRVLEDLAALGYDASWQVAGAVGVGAPHIRERTAIVATLGGVLAAWPSMAPWAERELAGWWTPEREPPRVSIPLAGPAVAWRIDAVAALGNAVCRPWAQWVATAARDAAPPVLDLFSDIAAPGMAWSDILPPSGVMWRGRLHEAPRVYDRGPAVARVKASPLCRLYGRLLPTARRADHRSGATSRETSVKNSRPLCEVAMMLPTPTHRDHRSGSVAGGSAASRDAAGGFRRLTDDAVSMSRLLPTPVASLATRGDCPGERVRNTPHLGAVAVGLAEAGALLATPTRCGNYNRAGASPASGDGLSTQAAKMVGARRMVARRGAGRRRYARGAPRRATLLRPEWVAWLMGWGPEVVPMLGGPKQP